MALAMTYVDLCHVCVWVIAVVGAAAFLGGVWAIVDTLITHFSCRLFEERK